MVSVAMTQSAIVINQMQSHAVNKGMGIATSP